jgi:hypothetical protein
VPPRGAIDDRRDLVEGHSEHVVQHEREPLGRAQRLEDNEQGETHRVGQQSLVPRVRPVGAVDDQVGHVDADRLLAPQVA